MADNPQVSVEIEDSAAPTLATSALQSTLNSQVGIATETAPASDTASSGLNGRLQRIAQRLTSLLTGQSDGTQQTKIRGGTDGTIIGNSGDALKTAFTLPSTYLRGVYGGLRVVTTENVFESLFSYDKQPLVWDEALTSGGTSTYNSNTNSIDMTVPTTNGASVVRQTFSRIRYNPSRTCQIIAAGNIGAGKANVRKRIGQFDTLDGLFFEQDGTTTYVVRRTSTSGSVVDTRVAQSAWNVDRFDGSGPTTNPSGITIDFSKHHAFFIQYAFQGFADICYGFYLNGQILFCHREATANVLSLPFMRTAHLPARVEITNTGTSASSTTFSYNSFTVKNEGGDSNTEGQIRTYSDLPLKTINTTTVPVISLRINSAFLRNIVDIVSSTIFVQTPDDVIWSVWINPTLTGSTFATSRGLVDIDTAASAMSGGTEIISGVLGQGAVSGVVSQDLFKLVNSLFGVTLSGSSEVVTLAARSRITTADILATISWREYP